MNQDSIQFQAFKLALGKGKKDMAQDAFQEATLVLNHLRLDKNSAAWWLYAALAAKTPDNAAMIQIGDMRIAVDAVKEIHQGDVIRGVTLLGRTEKLAAHLAQNDKVMGIFNRNFENHHLRIFLFLLLAVLVGVFAAGWWAH